MVALPDVQPLSANIPETRRPREINEGGDRNQRCCLHRRYPTTDSNRIRLVIPTQSDHRFRSYPTTWSDNFRIGANCYVMVAARKRARGSREL